MLEKESKPAKIDTGAQRGKRITMHIEKKISERRKAQGLTQEHLASEMGVSIAAVSKWETGNSLPDIMMLCSLADFFGITTDEMLGRTNHRRKVIIADDSDASVAFRCQAP